MMMTNYLLLKSSSSGFLHMVFVLSHNISFQLSNRTIEEGIGALRELYVNIKVKVTEQKRRFSNFAAFSL